MKSLAVVFISLAALSGVFAEDASAGNIIHFGSSGALLKNEFDPAYRGIKGVLHTPNGRIFFRFNDEEAVTTALERFGNVTLTQLSVEDVEKCVRVQAEPVWEGTKNRVELLKSIKKQSTGVLDFSSRCGLDAAASNFNGYHVTHFYLIGDYAYDSYDGGNYMWGSALKMLHVAYPTAKAGSEVNAFFSGKIQNGYTAKNKFDSITWSGDAPRDQRAIRRGWKRTKTKF